MSLTKKWKLKTVPVDAVFVTEDNYREVAEWCGGTVVNGASYVGTYIAPRIMVPTIDTGANKFSLKSTVAIAGKHAIFQNRRGYFVVLTADRFEELWEPVMDTQIITGQVDN